jgi:large subunit ribosomal protein L4
MASYDVIDLTNKKVGTIDLNEAVFAAPIRRHLLTEVINWQRAKARSGTQSVKTRTEVNGTTKKPYGQKHTGNARQGDTKSNQHRGGGVAFAPKPRSYDYALPKAKRRAALAIALSLKVKEGGLKIVKNFDLKEAKTKAVVGAIKAMQTGNTLLVDGDNVSLQRASRNIANSQYLHINGLNVMDLLKYPSIVMTESAVKTIETRLLGAE